MSANAPSLNQWQQQGKRISLLGQDIFYCTAGDETKPALLLIHGFPTASWDWRYQWQALSEDYFVITMDMLGFGFSAKPQNGDYRIAFQADLQQALLKHLNIQQYSILAHDYGDTVAQELLARDLDQHGASNGSKNSSISACILLNGGLFPETHKPVLVQKLLISPLGPLFARLYSYKKLQKTFAHICAKPLSDEELQGFWTLISQQQGLRVFHKLIRYMSERRQFRERWVGALQNTHVPLALINGSADPISGEHMVARYRELVGGENIVQLPGIGHYPQLEDSQIVLSAVTSFLTTVIRSGG
ncbi:alpha/beta fold hydrolase [Thalassolituus hydrocarboniclasticus]|uniref:Alpha/beta hydrolase n=1 Tax=Thalassolituus hydrocarboniclasticus TaxID=2742796 RepID=A0ABY6A8Q5_9GAMM|nr:alpha/beta hydrolase [Thalassolituus hydrocarboniclasticus]UXD86975.1 alpha/beta hydrolase [Thalassolituus hydrocarboniclasticus]